MLNPKEVIKPIYSEHVKLNCMGWDGQYRSEIIETSAETTIWLDKPNDGSGRGNPPSNETEVRKNIVIR